VVLLAALSVALGELTVALGELMTSTAPEVVRVYSSEGPAPALCEAAIAFSTNETVKVVSGPPPSWVEQAGANADVVCSSAEFMMSDYIHNVGLQVDTSTVSPLYTRSSAILVRPGNPKRIEDFPDLLEPGVRVMVVTGSGQTGLWEDMAAHSGDVQPVRRLRANIVSYAANSTEAVRLWREKKDIDAWITWDIWHMPLRTEAKLINVSKDYRVYRLCSVALTSRAHSKPQAARFVEFLASPTGARIFASWGWTTPATETGARVVGRDIAVVCDLGRKTSTNGAGGGLSEVQRLVERYESIGVGRSQLHISVVVQGEVTHSLLKDGSYRKSKGTSEGNPARSLVEGLIGRGVSLEVSGSELSEHGWSKEDLLDGVVIVAGAHQRIIDLQKRGYAYLAF